MNHAPRKTFRGFTLIEMMVVLGIIVVLTSIVFSSQSNFNNTVILSDTAYDIALTVRSAQNQGTGSRGAGSVYTANGYGVHFSVATPNAFFTFADTFPSASADPSVCHPAPRSDVFAPDAHPGNCAYDNGLDVGVQNYTIGNGVNLADFCVDKAGSWYCKKDGLISIDMTSVRPSTNITITADSFFVKNLISEACLKFVSAQGGARYVYVNQSGLISTTCPADTPLLP